VLLGTTSDTASLAHPAPATPLLEVASASVCVFFVENYGNPIVA
jgi:hypothetical protein